MKKIFLFLVLGTSILQTGCASYQNICQSTDWEQKGFNDAKAGLPIQSEINDCAGESTTSARYASGRDKGNTEFCTYNGGLLFGQQGGIYAGTCPKTLERAFKEGYLKGKAEYDRQQAEKGNK